MPEKLSCGHGREHLTEIDGQKVCHLCWLTDSGNYTYDLRTGPDRVYTAVERLAEQVKQLSTQLAEHGLLLQRLLNQEGKPL